MLADSKLKTRNPLSALNSFSNKNCSPRSDLIRNVTSRKVTLELKSMKDIEICWSLFSSGLFVEDETSSVTNLPSKSTGGNVSAPSP